MLAATLVVHPDEYALTLVEMPLLSPDYKSMRRYQIIYVVRDDNLSEYREDLGPASSFNAPPFRILGGVTEGTKVYFEHTVGELRDMADYMRLETGPKFQQRLKDKQDASTLLADLANQYEERSRLLKNQSHFGPTLSKQRDNFPRKAVNDGIKTARRNRQRRARRGN